MIFRNKFLGAAVVVHFGRSDELEEALLTRWTGLGRQADETYELVNASLLQLKDAVKLLKVMSGG